MNLNIIRTSLTYSDLEDLEERRGSWACERGQAPGSCCDEELAGGPSSLEALI